MNIVSGSLAALCVLPILPSQTVHAVGPGGFSQISEALAVAQPGDVIAVSQGIYEPFVVNFGVKIVAADGAYIRGVAPMTPSDYFTTFAPPTGQTAHVVGLIFGSNTTTQPHVVSAQSGQVVFEDCIFGGGHPSRVHYGLECIDSDVILRACLFNPYHSGLLVDGGSLVATDCTIRPRDLGGWFYNVPYGPWGVEVIDGDARFSFCEIRGMTRQWNVGSGWPAIGISGTSDVELADCIVMGGDSPTSGLPVPCIVNNGNNPVRYARGTIIGGLGYIQLPFGTWAQRGPAFIGPAMADALLAGVSSTAGLRMGSSYGFALVGEPNRMVAVLLTLDLTPPQTHPLALQPIRFDPATAVPFGFGVTGSLGYYVPPGLQIPAGNLGVTTWLHPLMLDGNAIQVGPTLGGMVF